MMETDPKTGARLLRGVASFLSFFYVSGVKVRAFLYRHGLLPSQKFPAPVISVGNLTCGGTGKTPMVEFVAKALMKKWRRPAILSRGYAAEQTPEGLVNDEFLLLKQNLPETPHFAGPDRIKRIREAISRNDVDCVILDDGFQHLKIRRNVEIVLVDALNPFSNRRVLPRGLLREPINGLSRADVIVITRSNQTSIENLRAIKDEIKAIAPGKPIALTMHRAVELTSPDGATKVPCEGLAKQKVWAFCGIGNPDSFKLTLRGAGAILAGFTAFPDHHRYTLEDLKVIYAQARNEGASALVTTQKDGVKLGLISQLGPLPLYVLKIEVAVVHGGEDLERKVLDW